MGWRAAPACSGRAAEKKSSLAVLLRGYEENGVKILYRGLRLPLDEIETLLAARDESRFMLDYIGDEHNILKAVNIDCVRSGVPAGERRIRESARPPL